MGLLNLVGLGGGVVTVFSSAVIGGFPRLQSTVSPMLTGLWLNPVDNKPNEKA